MTALLAAVAGEPAGGRYRHHEHHAGERDPHGEIGLRMAWARGRDIPAPPDRIGHAQPGGRRHRRGAGATTWAVERATG